MGSTQKNPAPAPAPAPVQDLAAAIAPILTTTAATLAAKETAAAQQELETLVQLEKAKEQTYVIVEPDKAAQQTPPEVTLPIPTKTKTETKLIVADPGDDNAVSATGFRLFITYSDAAFAELKLAPYRNCVRDAKGLTVTYAGSADNTSRLRITVTERSETPAGPLHRTTVVQWEHLQYVTGFQMHQEIPLDDRILETLTTLQIDATLALAWVDADGVPSSADDAAQASFTIVNKSVAKEIYNKVFLAKATPRNLLSSRDPNQPDSITLKPCDVLFLSMEPVAPVPQAQLQCNGVLWPLTPSLSMSKTKLQFLFPTEFYAVEHSGTQEIRFKVSLQCGPNMDALSHEAAVILDTGDSSGEISDLDITDQPPSPVVPNPRLVTDDPAAPTKTVLIQVDREAVIKFSEFPQLHWTTLSGTTKAKIRVIKRANTEGQFRVYGLRPGQQYEMWYSYPKHGHDSATVVVRVPTSWT
jgi:hypothetical protein